MVAFLSLLAILVFLIPIITIAILYNRVNQIEREVRRLSQGLPQPTAVPKVASAPHPAPPAEQLRPVPSPAQQRAAESVKVPPAVPSPALPPPAPSRSKEEWEALIGGKLLNRIGALALIIGTGFFLKYAFDHEWINESVRVLIGGLLGGALLLGAARTHAKGLQIFAQGLVGAGISILYLSVYASFNFYHLLPQLAAFGLMTGVTAIAFAHAFKYDSLAVALLAWLGGFLTPFLLSTGESNELGLFTYIALLDAGILLIAIRKTTWTVLEPLALCATWLVYALWHSAYYAPHAFALTLYFVAVFWLLFLALSTGRARTADTSAGVLRGIAASANALFASVAFYRLLEPEHHDWAAGAEFLMAVLIALGILWVYRKRGHDIWIAFSALTAGILLIDATAIEFTTYTTVTLWAVEAFGFAWLGARWNRQYCSWLAFALFAAAGVKLIATAGAIVPLPDENVLLFFNRRGLTYAVLAATAWRATGFFTYLQSSRAIVAVLAYGAAATIFLMLSVEVSAHFTRLIHLGTTDGAAMEFNRWMALAAVWAAYGALLVWIGIGSGSLPLYVAGLLSLLVGICASAIRGIAIDPVASFSIIVNWRFAAIIFIAACGFVIVRRLGDPWNASPWQPEIFATLRMLLLLLLLILATGETRDAFEREIALTAQTGGGGASGEVDRWENLKQLSLSSAWLIYSIIIMGVGIWRRSRGLRVGSIALFGVTILKIFIYDLSFLDTLYRIFSFIGLGVILLAVSYAYQRYKGVIFAPEDAAPPSSRP